MFKVMQQNRKKGIKQKTNVGYGDELVKFTQRNFVQGKKLNFTVHRKFQ